MDRSTEEITALCVRQVKLIIEQEVQLPSCPLKKEQAKWKKERIIKAVAKELNPNVTGAMEIVVKVEA